MMKRIEFPGNYYDLTGYVNNSLLTIYEKDPKDFWINFLGLGEQQEPNMYMKLGTLIHTYILEPEEFRNKYKIIDYDPPKSNNQRRFAAEIANKPLLGDMQKALVTSYRIAYECSTDNDVAIEKKAAKLYEDLKAYIDALQAQFDGKEVITWSQYDKCGKIKEALKGHVGAWNLLNSVGQMNELEMRWQDEETSILCKAKMDAVQIDPHKKTINITDIKTSGKNFKEFYENLEDAGYIRQLAFYSRAVREYLKAIGVEGGEKFKVNGFIIYVNTVDNKPPYLIGIKDAHLQRVDKLIQKTLVEINECFNQEWTVHTKEYYINKYNVDKWIK